MPGKRRDRSPAVGSRTVLVVDDDDALCAVLVAMLAQEGLQAESASDGVEALARIERVEVDAVVVDLRMPRMDGMALLQRLRSERPTLPVIILTGEGDVPLAVEAMRAGATDFLLKPADRGQLLGILRREWAKHTDGADLVGASAAFAAALAEADRVAPTSARVLVVGETGSGKELFARRVHASSPRRDHPLVAVNIAAVPETLFEAELFGHRRGAFTGAVGDKPGAAARAHGGTLFLDEIGDASPGAQAKLLRFAETGEVRALGATHDARADVRLITATHRDLEAEVAAGHFRADLFHRLSTVTLRVPALRERDDDWRLLLDHFLAPHQLELDTFEGVIAGALGNHDWPGNVREVRTVAERLALLGTQARRSDLPFLLGTPPVGPTGLGPQVEDAERRAIRHALARCGGNKSAAARHLGISRRALYDKLDRLGLQE